MEKTSGNVDNNKSNITITSLINQIESCTGDICTSNKLNNIMDDDKDDYVRECYGKLSKCNITTKENFNCNSSTESNTSSHKEPFGKISEHDLLNNNANYVADNKTAKKTHLITKINEFMVEKDRIKDNLNAVIKELTLTEMQNKELKNDMFKFSRNIAKEKLILMENKTKRHIPQSDDEYLSSDSVAELSKKHSDRLDHNLNEYDEEENQSCTMLQDNYTQTNPTSLNHEADIKQTKMLSLLNEVELLQHEITQTNEIKKALAELKNENDELRERFSNLLKSNLSDKSHQVVHYEMQKTKLLEELNILKSKMQDNLMEIDELKKQNEEYNATNSRQEDLIKSLYKESNFSKEYQELYVKKIKENEILMKEMENNQILCNKLKRENDGVIQELQQELLKKKQKVDDLSRAVAVDRSRLLEHEKLHNKLAEFTKNQIQLKRDNEHLRNMVRSLKEETNIDKKSRKSRNKANRRQSLKLISQVKKLEETLHRERNGFELYHGDFLKQRHQFEVDLQNVKQEKTHLQIVVFDLESDKIELTNNFNGVKNQLTNLMKRYDNLNLEKEILKDKETVLNQKLSKSEEQNAIFTQKICNLEYKLEEFEELQNDNRFLREKLQEVAELKKQQYDIKLLFNDLDKQTENLNRSVSNLMTIWNKEITNVPVSLSLRSPNDERDDFCKQFNQIEERIKSTTSLLEVLVKSKDELLAKRWNVSTATYQTDNNVTQKQVKKFTIKQPSNLLDSNHKEYEVRYLTHLPAECDDCTSDSKEPKENEPSKSVEEILNELIYLNNDYSSDIPVYKGTSNTCYLMALILNRFKTNEGFVKAAISSDLEEINKMSDGIPENVKQRYYEDIDNFIMNSSVNRKGHTFENFQEEHIVEDFWNLSKNNEPDKAYNSEIVHVTNVIKFFINTVKLEYRFIAIIFGMILMIPICNRICADINFAIINNKINTDTFNWIDIVNLICRRWNVKRITPV